MIPLKIDFQEGFQNDEVVVRIDGKEVFRADNVTTKLTIGLAGSFTKEIPLGKHEVEVFLPRRDVSRNLALYLAEKPLYLGVHLRNGTQYPIEYCVSAEPFGYC